MENEIEEEYSCEVFTKNLVDLLKANKIKMVDYANAVGYKPQTIYSWRSKMQKPNWVDKAFKTFVFLEQIEYFEPMLLFKKNCDINKYKKYENKIKKAVIKLKKEKEEFAKAKIIFTDFDKLKLTFNQQFIYLIKAIIDEEKHNRAVDKDKFKTEIGLKLYDCIANAIKK